MKSLISIFLCLFVFSFTYGQEVYWSVYTMKIDAGDEKHVIESLEEFFKSETGKKLPTAWINAKMFGNTQDDYNLQVGFSTSDKEEFGKMYSGVLDGNSDYKVLMHALEDHSKPRGSYLGKSINFRPSMTAKVDQIYFLKVDDPVLYATEFEKMTAAVLPTWDNQVQFNLHAIISGHEPDVTHIAVVSAPDFETMLSVNDDLFQMPAFKAFQNKVKDIRTITGTTMTSNVMRFNVPDNAMVKN